MLRYLLAVSILLLGGCSLLPEIAHQPTFHNPFPQLSRVAVAPFFNMSEEPTLNTRDVAVAYFAELQSVPGFEVVPVASVEEAIQRHGLRLSSPEEVRRLAGILGVDAVVIGAVTDYSPYYPPRLAMQVRWYSANPCYHSIPPGYGLPWGTPGEQNIPSELVFEAEMALAKAQLDTQTPGLADEAPPEQPSLGPTPRSHAPAEPPADLSPDALVPDSPEWRRFKQEAGIDTLAAESASDGSGSADGGSNTSDAAGKGQGAGADGPAPAELDPMWAGQAEMAVDGYGFPPDWPDPRGFIPPPPRQHPRTCRPSDAPVLQHTALYVGNDPEVTSALASYHFFRDDARLGGWQSYLQRSDDYIRFCCHMHIAEMLTARGGAGETRVVWRWPVVR